MKLTKAKIYPVAGLDGHVLKLSLQRNHLRNHQLVRGPLRLPEIEKFINKFSTKR